MLFIIMRKKAHKIMEKTCISFIIWSCSNFFFNKIINKTKIILILIQPTFKSLKGVVIIGLGELPVINHITQLYILITTNPPWLDLHPLQTQNVFVPLTAFFGLIRRLVIRPFCNAKQNVPGYYKQLERQSLCQA